MPVSGHMVSPDVLPDDLVEQGCGERTGGADNVPFGAGFVRDPSRFTIAPEDAPAFRRGEESGLGVLLASDIFLDHLRCCAASSGNEVRVRPERGNPGAKRRELLTQQS